MPYVGAVTWSLKLVDIEELPVPTVALAVLAWLPPDRAFVREWAIKDLIAEAQRLGPARARIAFGGDVAVTALAAAWGHLVAEGLLVAWPRYEPSQPNETRGDVYRVTALGREMRREGERAGPALAARRRIGVELHPTLARRLRTEIAAGAFETATFNALRAVEARVRQLCAAAGDPPKRRLIGRALMQHALRPGGPLADPDADEGEQVGTMELFAGTFGSVRNLLAHTDVEWPDPVEAAEYVLLADLLMRLVDRAEQRLVDAGALSPD